MPRKGRRGENPAVHPSVAYGDSSPQGEPMAHKKQKSSARKQRTRKFLWYHLNLPLARPHGILADPQAVSGPTRPALLAFQAGRSERNSASWLSLPFTCRQLSGKAVGRVLVFIIALRYAFSLVYHPVHHKSTIKHAFSRIFPRAVRTCRHKTEIGAAKRPPQQIQHITFFRPLSTVFHSKSRISPICTLLKLRFYESSHLAKCETSRYYIDTKR